MNQTEYELIAEVFAAHRQSYGGRTDSVVLELIDDMARVLAGQYKNFNYSKFVATAKKEIDK
jgi:hypothetical protein